MIVASPMFRKLLFRSLVVILVAVLALDFLLTRFIAQHERDVTQRQLQAQASILAAELAAQPARRLADWTGEAQRGAHTRITVIQADGRVLADSEADSRAMENHADRPEIRAALQGRQGASVRHSATLNRDLLYLALPVNLAGNAGCVLRLAVPLAQVDEAVAQVRWRILEASSIAALLALGIAYFTSRSLSRRIRRVQQFAGGLVKARFADTLPPEPDDELGALARSLNGMSSQLRGMLERLKLEAARREAILDGIVEGVLAVDHELCVAFCNQAFVRAVGARYPVPERLPVLELVRDPAFLNLLTSTLVKAEQRKLRLQLPAAEGRAFEVQAAPLELRSGRGAIIILHDVTGIERLERVRRDFVANVSHELRTPLAAIQGYAETLLAGGLEDQARNREFVGIIQAHAVRLTNICTDLLALSELESGGAGPQTQPMPVADALEFAIAAVQREASLREVKIHRPAPGSAVVAAGGTGLEQVLVNLLGNAVKFNRPGGEVRVDVTELDDGRVRIAVADNGIGIPSADLPRIFERFYRVDKARSRETGGTGLGLAIVKHAVERMGGSVTVESQLGQGSRFVVTLPGADIKGKHEAD